MRGNPHAARVYTHPPRFRKAQLGKRAVAFLQDYPMLGEMLRGKLSKGLVADRACSWSGVAIDHAHVLKGLSQELPS
jgi:hypothetical protein